MTDSGLTQKKFDRLLDWLDPDRERAGAKLLEIRRCLVKFFVNQQCVEAQELADETINRVAERPPVSKTSMKANLKILPCSCQECLS